MSKNYLLSCVGFYAALFILLTNHDVFAIADGEATFDYPQIGALLQFDSNRLDQVCSGTLIGTKTFLTAAHCVCNMMNPGVVGSCNSTENQEGCIECNPKTQDFRVFFQGIGIKKVEGINIAPEYNKNSIGNIGPDSDYATLILESDIKGVIPAELAKKEYYNTNQNIYIAGFGAIEEKTTDVSYGIKRYGNNSISTCSEEENLYYEEAICYKKYKKSCACGRDSGGPVFLQSETDNNIYIIGITHGPVASGDSYHCNDSRSIELASSAYYYKKINRGSIDYNDDFYLVPVRQYSGPFEDYEKNDFYLPSGVKRLSFTINGTDNNIEDKNNYNLSLSYKNGTNFSTIECKNEYNGTFQSCIVENPLTGHWAVDLIKRNGPGGEIQLMVTALVDKSLADSLRSECNFLDLPENSPYRIKKLCELGVLNGVRDLIFEPDKFVNRAEFSKMLVLTAETEEVGIQFHDQKVNTFSDVDEGSWYEGYVKKLANKPVIINNEQYGYVIEGYSDGEFKPDNSISMPEMIKMVMQTFFPVTPNSPLWNFLSRKWYTPFLKGAQDIPIAPIFDIGNFTPVMEDKDKYHLHTEDGDVRFATRKEAAKALYDAYQIYISGKQ